MDMNKKKSTSKLDKSPYNRRGEKITKRAFESVDQSVKPVAKDTNKTRRKTTRARIVGETVPEVNPHSDLKAVLKRAISTRH